MNRKGTFRKGNKINLGRKQSQDEIEKRKRSIAKRKTEQGYTEAELNKGKKISQSKQGYHWTEEQKKILSEAHIGTKVKLTPEGRERKRQSLLGNRYQQNRTAPCSEECKQKIGKANAINMRKKWQEESYSSRQMKAIHNSPNKQEQKLTVLIDTNHLPFKYVGDGQFILGGKCPDFLNTDGKKQLIELFGTYWHGILDVGNRVEYFRQYGFSTLVIWEDELENESKVLKKIKRFLTVG